MSSTIFQKTFDFLKNLSKNNNREWFNENKSSFLEAQKNVVEYLEELIPAIAQFDEEILKLDAKKSVFRIYRDIRFSLDKTPYKTHFGASLGMGKNKKISGYYLHIEPGNSFVAGGIYHPEKDILKKIRLSIDKTPDAFLKIINDKNFKKYFTELSQEDKLQRIPQGFEKENPMEDFLKLKSYVVRYSLKDQDLMENSATEYIAKICREIKPLNDFIEDSVG